MKSIEDLANTAGRKNPIVRKELIRLDNGMSNLNESGNLLARLLKKKTGMDVEEMGPFPTPDYDELKSGEISFARDYETRRNEIQLTPTLSNIAVLGMAGKGKTNLLRLLAYKFIQWK